MLLEPKNQFSLTQGALGITVPQKRNFLSTIWDHRAAKIRAICIGRVLLRGLKVLCFLASAIFGLGLNASAEMSFVPLTPATIGALRAIAIGNGTYVATGDFETVVSTNGVDFRALPYNGYHSDVIFADGRFVVVGHDIQTSTDGVNWTIAQQDPQGLVSVTWGNGMFVAVGGRQIFYSTDGITWEAQEFHPETRFNTVKFGGGVCVALGTIWRNGPQPGMVTPAGAVMGVSTNGTNWRVWNSSSVRVEMFLRITEHARGKFYGVYAGESFVSPTGTNNWTSFNRAGFVDLEFLNGHFVYLRKDPGTVVNIYEAGNWGTAAIGITNTLFRAAYDGSEYYFVGDKGAIVKTVGAQKLSSLNISPPKNGNVQITVTGRPGGYSLQQSWAPDDTALDYPENQIHFMMAGTSTNFSLPVVQPNWFFRLIERN